MGVAILNPQDCLQNPLSSRRGLISLPPEMKLYRNPNPNPTPNPNNRSNRAQPNRRKRSPNTSPPARAAVVAKVEAEKIPVLGQVKILKRGEQLPKLSPAKAVSQPINIEKKKDVDLDLGSTHRLGPDPDRVQTQICFRSTGFYAGSAFFTSPPPSSLPVPAFFTKKNNIDDATCDLRRMLGLSL